MMGNEPECTSMKTLLKQVYGVHTAKIKCLEDEIDDLKKNLLEANGKLKSNESECKRCIELEKAFNSCKAAMLEQSKMFDNIGQKFSNFNQAESRISDVKSLKSLQDNIDDSSDQPAVSVLPVKKVDLSTNSKVHFLKNLMSLNEDENLESLELSAPLQKNIYQEYSTLNPDSHILVPNTLDFDGDIRDNEKKIEDATAIGLTVNSSIQYKETVKTNIAELSKTKENKFKRNKRSSEDSAGGEEKLNKENEINNLHGNKKHKSSARVVDEDCLLLIQANDATTLNCKNPKNITDEFNSSKKGNTPALDIKIQKVTDKSNVMNKGNPNLNCSDNSNIPKDDSFSTTVSPSLLPFKEKTNHKVTDNLLITTPAGDLEKHCNKSSIVLKDGSFHGAVSPSLLPCDKPEPKKVNSILEDINDFQIPSSSKKVPSDGSTWTSCDKKKLTRKASNPRPIKSTSKFKMQLDSLPPNYKKPSYRQTKLSKTIFQPKSTNTQQQDPDIDCIIEEEKFQDFVEGSTMKSKDLPSTNGLSKTVDFDATCIPDNYEYEVISSNKISLDESTSKKSRKFENSIMLVKDSSGDSDSFDEMIVEPKSSKQNKDKSSNLINKHIDVSQLGNSFDRLPKKPEPDYKYKEETVRKKSERKLLTAFDCKECEKYYSELGLSDEEKKLRMQKCSRHRSKFAPPPTPEHFWELEFPDTQECKARGYLNETQKVKLKTHRRRPL